jgi:hypothetical protein
MAVSYSDELLRAGTWPPSGATAGPAHKRATADERDLDQDCGFGLGIE